MPKAKKQSNNNTKSKLYAVPSSQKKKDFGVPRFAKGTGRQAMPAGSSRPTSTAALSALANQQLDGAGPSVQITSMAPIDASLTIRDSSTKAFMRELRKVIERSDVIIQVLDARDPEGTRSRWVEEEVRKREADGKKLLGVVNKIDLVPRANLELWLKHLRHYFPCMPFKSSTQSQRNNLSQNAVPVTQTAKPGEKAVLPDLPVTSSSLGAPALLHLLKQYALSTPHSSLTVGVVGYPNVGKSSLINSLKRSRACAVAAMPGKTRVVQEVILDKGVKIIDCPGVVLADMGLTGSDEQSRQKQAEIMLRNCIKAELVEDPIAPVEVILNKTDPALLMKLYNIPEFADVREFLIRIALVRGRLGKGGIPDLEGSAVSVLRDWNSGKIPYFTSPPQIHPTAAPARAAETSDVGTDGDGMAVEGETGQIGGDKVLNTLSEAFTLDGLLDFAAGGEGEFAEDAAEQDFAFDDEEAADVMAAQPVPAFPSTIPDDSDASDDDSAVDSDDDFGFRPPAHPTGQSGFGSIAPSSATFMPVQRKGIDTNRLFTAEELATLPASVLDSRAKAAAKKAKKRKLEAERTGGQLAFGLLGMGVDESLGKPEAFAEHQHAWDPAAHERLSKKEKRVRAKQKAKEREKREVMALRERQMREAGGDMDMDMDGDGAQEQRKEQDFANFLANVAADSDEEL